jgi:predicted TIM-barrel fold metal-dependent hydrolase
VSLGNRGGEGLSRRFGMLLDAHVHMFPVVRGVCRGQGETTSERYGMIRRQGRGLERFFPPSFEYSGFPYDVFLQYLDWAGIEKAILFQSCVYGYHNDYYVHHAVGRHSERFKAYALVDPRTENARTRIEAVMQRGFVGIKLDASELPIRLDSEQVLAAGECLTKHNGVLALDLGWEPGAPDYYQIDELKTLLRKLPELRLHVAHAGLGGKPIEAIGESVLQEIGELSQIGSDVVYDISAFPDLVPETEQYPYPSAQALLHRVVSVLGADAILWGSDAPQILRRCTYGQSVRWVLDCDGLDEDQKRKITFGNANRWYFEGG